jgi:zinc finger protein
MRERCPVCDKDTLETNFREENIEYFGRMLLISSYCSSCGYRHNDVLLVDQKEPVKITFVASGEEDLKVRVIRSSHASIMIPEIGVSIDPVTYGESFVSNVEGLLLRIINVMSQLLRDSSENERKEILERLKKIGKMRNGLERLTIIINDPSGNSAIISDRAKIERGNLNID